MNYKIQNWREIARPEQQNPIINSEKWLWLLLAGRGFGKTRTGSESIMELVNSGQYKNIAIIGKTVTEARDVMVEGISGILSSTLAQRMFKNQEENINDFTIIKFKFYRSRNIVIWENGARAYLFGADHFEKIRGYQFDLVWMDEFAKYRYPDQVWQQVVFSLRIGDNPKCIITSTPKPLRILKLLSEASFTHLTRGSTFQNEKNLNERFLKFIKDTYGDTFIGRQEIEGELIMFKENTVWKRSDIVYKEIDRGKLERIVIGIDPAVSSNQNSDETGIIVAGLGYDGKLYVIDDLSGKYTPQEWARIACNAQRKYDASCIVAETNNGGDLVNEMIKTIDPYAPYKSVHAIRDKVARAEPIALLYNTNRIFHIREFVELEDQMCDLSYTEKNIKSPDRVDALVWTINELKQQTDYINFSIIG